MQFSLHNNLFTTFTFIPKTIQTTNTKGSNQQSRGILCTYCTNFLKRNLFIKVPPKSFNINILSFPVVVLPKRIHYGYLAYSQTYKNGLINLQLECKAAPKTMIEESYQIRFPHHSKSLSQIQNHLIIYAFLQSLCYYLHPTMLSYSWSLADLKTTPSRPDDLFMSRHTIYENTHTGFSLVSSHVFQRNSTLTPN